MPAQARPYGLFFGPGRHGTENGPMGRLGTIALPAQRAQATEAGAVVASLTAAESGVGPSAARGGGARHGGLPRPRRRPVRDTPLRVGAEGGGRRAAAPLRVEAEGEGRRVEAEAGALRAAAEEATTRAGG
jgi:hypothetical protein